MAVLLADIPHPPNLGGRARRIVGTYFKFLSSECTGMKVKIQSMFSSLTHRHPEDKIKLAI